MQEMFERVLSNDTIHITVLSPCVRLEEAHACTHATVAELVDMLGIRDAEAWQHISYFLRLPEESTIATLVCIEMFARSKHQSFPRLLRVDSATVAGTAVTRFQIIDASALAKGEEL